MHFYSGPPMHLLSGVDTWALSRYSSESSHASIPCRADQAVGRRTESDDRNSDRRSQETRGIIVMREAPPLGVVKVPVRKQAEPERGGEHNRDRNQPARCVLLRRWQGLAAEFLPRWQQGKEKQHQRDSLFPGKALQHQRESSGT